MLNGATVARTVAVCAAPAVLAACAAHLPTYPAMSDEDALRIIADRLDSVRSVSASADLTLTGPDGRSVRLDGAFVAAPPKQARVRAWKFGTAVLDLTVLPDGVWAFAAESEHRASGPATDPSRIPGASIAPFLELLSGGYFRRAHAVPGESTDRTLAVAGPALGRDSVACEIDRATLTPQRFVLAPTDAEGDLTLDRYALVQDIAWPHRLRFRGKDGEIVVRLDDVELNTELPASAFTPPPRAKRLP